MSQMRAPSDGLTLCRQVTHLTMVSVGRALRTLGKVFWVWHEDVTAVFLSGECGSGLDSRHRLRAGLT